MVPGGAAGGDARAMLPAELEKLLWELGEVEPATP